MYRVGGGPGSKGSGGVDEERQAANAAVVGNTVIFGVLVACIHFSPAILELLGFGSSAN